MTDPKDDDTSENADAIEKRNLAMTKAALMGKTQDEIASEFNVSESTVKRVSRAYGWKKLKRQIDERKLRKVLVEVVREQERELDLRERGIKRCPVSNRLFFETIMQFPKDSRDLRPDTYSLIPTPPQRNVEIVAFDPVACTYTQRHYISD